MSWLTASVVPSPCPADGPPGDDLPLACAPVEITVAYEINPYMHVQVHPDPELALAEHDGLVSTLGSAGAEIEFMDPVPGLPDLVFTANAGVVDGDAFVPSRFRHPERQGETVHDMGRATSCLSGVVPTVPPVRCSWPGTGPVRPSAPRWTWARSWALRYGP